MPDFNKGDFTQQGVNGHVNANVRLNEKRLVNIDLTSDEEAEGCTITGTVKDLLNDKVYNIGSGGGGGGVDLLHTELVLKNEEDTDYTLAAPDDTLLCTAYAIGSEELGAPANWLITEAIDEDNTLGIDFVTKHITIAANSEVTFMLYYLPSSTPEDCNIVTDLRVESVENMVLDEGVYYLDDAAESSSITINCGK